MSVKRIALFGGAFDPVHNGHIHLAREFAARLSWDAVVLMPTSISPHKTSSSGTEAAHRLEMCILAVSDDPLFSVSDHEICRGGASFTIDTLKWMKEGYPDAELFLLTGADMFMTLGSWHRFDEISKTAVLCAAPRGEYDFERLTAYAQRLTESGARCVIEDIPVMELSSTDIRRKIAAKEALSGLVPEKVAAYINKTGIYKDDAGHDKSYNEQYIEMLRGRLSEKRFKHSLAVAEQAKFLAGLYGTDPEKAYTAGLLHDIMKDAKPPAQLQMLKDFDIILDTATLSLPKCWHAVAGAAFAERILGIDDRDMLNAIRYHTTARAGMSPLEVTLYLADYTSADRDFHDVDTIRKLAMENRDAAMQYALTYTIKELVGKERVIHPDSIAAYNEYVTVHPTKH